jgi:hypothetical protein
MASMTMDPSELEAALAWVAEHDGELLRLLADYDSTGPDDGAA